MSAITRPPKRRLRGSARTALGRLVPWPLGLLGAGLLALAVSGCTVRFGDEVTGSGVLETRTYDESGFDAIDASQAFQVEVTHGDRFAVSVTADDNLFDEIRVEARGDTLHIGLASGLSVRGSVTLEATVTMPELRAIEVSGASSVTVGDGFPRIGRLDVRASGASRVSGTVTADILDAELSGASNLTLRGEADELVLHASGASSFRLEQFPAATARIELSGASSANVDVSDELDRVRVSGASRLRYTGSPRLGDVESSGASTISGGQ